MTYEQACRKIKEHFEALWTDAVPMIYPNEKEDLGDVKRFGRMTIRPASGRQVAVGGRKHRRQGLTTIQLFVAQGTGIHEVGAMEEMAARIFTDHIVPGIRFSHVGADRAGNDGYGYYQSNVNASFQFDVK